MQTTVAGNNVTLSWTPSTDNAATPIQYEMLKDDPAFGTIVVGSTYERNLTDTGVTGIALATSCVRSTPPETGLRPPRWSR